MVKARDYKVERITDNLARRLNTNLVMDYHSRSRVIKSGENNGVSVHYSRGFCDTRQFIPEISENNKYSEALDLLKYSKKGLNFDGVFLRALKDDDSTLWLIYTSHRVRWLVRTFLQFLSSKNNRLEDRFKSRLAKQLVRIKDKDIEHIIYKFKIKNPNLREVEDLSYKLITSSI